MGINPSVETGLEVVMGTGANLTEVFTTTIPGHSGKGPRVVAFKPSRMVTLA